MGSFAQKVRQWVLCETEAHEFFLQKIFLGVGKSVLRNIGKLSGRRRILGGKKVTTTIGGGVGLMFGL